LLIAAAAAAQAPRVVSGRVLELRDSLPVSGMLAELAGTALRTFTDSQGRFTLAGAPPGPVLIAVRGPAFLPDTVLLAEDRDTLTVYLAREIMALAPVEVRGERHLARQRFEELAQPSVVSITGGEFKRAPSVLEPDVIRTIQLLPGTVAKNDYSIGYNVRGGESDQNLVQLDGITVFNPSHLGGLFSTFDVDAIDRADFLTGGFPAGFSGRLSSVLDIALRPGAADRWHGTAHVSLLSSKLLLEGPLPGPATFLASARRTYADQVVRALSKEELPYYFTDVVGKIHVPTGGGSLAITGYWGRDAFDLPLSQDSTADQLNVVMNWGNRLGGATWRAPLAGGTLETRVAISEFTTTLGFLPDVARFDNHVRLLTAGATLETRPHANHALRVGTGIERYTVRYRIESPVLQTTFLDAGYAPIVLSAFADEQWSPTTRLMLRPGLRLEHVTGAGFTGLSPRVAFKAFLTDALAVTGSAGRYYQPIHSIRDQELPVAIYEFWIGADRYIPVARSDHAVLGFEGWLGSDFQVTFEGYRKTFANLVTPDRAQDLRREGDEFVPASGNAWGGDLLIRRHAGAVRGWIAYGFTRATRISEGVTYPPAHDRRHTLNVVLEAPGPLGSDFSVRWGYGSPLPYTGFFGQWDHRRYNATDHSFDDVLEEPIAGPRNGERFPPYSRLDLGLRWSYRLLGAQWQTYLQVANAYNRRNVFLYLFNYDRAPPTRSGVSQLPFLPAFGFEVRF
jgi:hypothetical protein